MRIKLILCLLATVLTASWCNAQIKSRFSVSLSAEYNVSGLRNSKSPYNTHQQQNKTIDGLFYGLGVEYAAWSRVSFISGISVADRGGKESYVSNTTGLEGERSYQSFYRKVSCRYAIVPYMARIYVPIEKVRLYAEAGGYLALRLSSSANGNDASATEAGGFGGVNTSMQSWFSVHDKSHTNKYDAGLSAGFGISVPVTNKISFQASTRVFCGLRQVDALNNNTFRQTATPNGNITYLADYYNLNSHAKYVAGTWSAGLVGKL